MKPKEKGLYKEDRKEKGRPEDSPKNSEEIRMRQ